MNNFEAKSLKEASSYLSTRLLAFEKDTSFSNVSKKNKEEKNNVYVIEAKKDSMMKRLVGSIFK